MRLISQSRLSYQEGNSDKVYEVDLCELSSEQEQRYLVNFRYGRRGQTLREGTKTTKPVALVKAQELFNSVVVSKLNKGYVDTQSATPSAVAVSAVATNQAPLVERIINALLVEADSKKRSRMIWRLAELGDHSAVEPIVACAGKGAWLEDYSIAWALGRLQATNQYSLLESLAAHKKPQVCHIAFESLLLISDQARCRTLLHSVLEQLPASLQVAIDRNNAQAISQQLAERLQKGASAKPGDILLACYQLSQAYPILYQALLEQLKVVPLTPGYFPGIRAVFKAAELRLDAPVFAVLVQRIETAPAFFHRSAWSDWVWTHGTGSVKASKELKKPDSKLAFSNRTRHYFRRRAWRALKRIGEAGDARYVDMATELLLQFHDTHASPPRKSDLYRWDSNWNRELVSSRYYGPFAGFLSVNHILFTHDPQQALSPGRIAWLQLSESIIESAARTEAFPELWDQQPAQALRLLKESFCEPVHIFAGGVLAEQAEFCRKITADELAVLLSSPYPSTCQFALAQARLHLEQGGDQTSLVLALLSCSLADARELGLASLSAASFKGDTALLAKLLLIPFEDVHLAVVAMIGKQALYSRAKQELLNALIEAVLAASDSVARPLDDNHVSRLISFVNEHLNDAAKQLSLSQLEQLFNSKHIPRQLFAAHLLVLNKIAFKDIPEHFLEAIHHSDSADIKAVGAMLLGKQSDRELVEQLPLLVSLYHQSETAERAALLTLFARIAANYRHGDEQVMQALLPLTFKGEQASGQHDELVLFFQSHLLKTLGQLDNDSLWRLLQARSSCAQRVAAIVLSECKSEAFSVKQWALMAHHSDVSVREFSFQAYRDNPGATKEYCRDALRILNSQWDDARHFAFEFFREHYQKEDWTPAVVVFVCDNTRADVQQFGRELLQTFFDAEQGPEYLEKLSQHPSSNVQLFASHFLVEHAAGHPERILPLTFYFTNVLSQVNKSRVCKDRIIEFLVSEAEKNQEVATMVSTLLYRISLTVVHKDKAALIKAMLTLKNHYPALVPAVLLKDVAIKQPA